MIRYCLHRFADHLKFPTIICMDLHAKIIAAHTFQICLYIHDHILQTRLHLPERISQLPKLIPGNIRNFLLQISLFNFLRRF